MPARYRRSSMRSVRRPRRRVSWAQTETTVNFTANSQWSTIDLLGNYSSQTGAVRAGITILRTHLWVLPHAPAAGDSFVLGLSILNTDDLAAPQTSALIPNPISQPYVDWMLSAKYEFDVNLRLPVQHTDFAGAVIDLRSKRKCHTLQDTYALTILQESVGTVAKAYDVFSRVLLALP